MKESIFTKIINHDLPSHLLYEDDICIAILDIFPSVKGQCLIIPKEQIDYAFDLDDTTYEHILAVAKKIAKVLDASLSTLRTCLVIEGFDVPHTHIKLYPIQPGEEPLGPHLAMGAQADDKELAVLATELRAAIANAME